MTLLVTAFAAVICTALCDCAGDRIDVAEFRPIIAAANPFQLVQVHGIGHAEILEGTEQLPVDGLR